MNKKDLIRKVTEIIKESGAKRSIRTDRHVFHISDDKGNSSDFIVKGEDKKYTYTSADVELVINVAIEAIKDNIKHGEPTDIHGFGSLHPHFREARKVKKPGTSEWVSIDGHIVPKFDCGKELKAAAKLYEMSLNDKPAFTADTFEEE